MRAIFLIFQIVLLGLSSASVLADQTSYHLIPSKRAGSEVPFWLIQPDNATHTVILFAGGDGVLDIGRGGVGQHGNFLVRSSDLFAKQGMLVAIVDKPSDKKNLFHFRTTKKHAKDIKAVIMYLKRHYPENPIWLVGTSRGTISVANIAARFHGKAEPAGIVLTSSVTRASKKKRNSLEDVDLSAITVPTYIVHNKDDQCKVTPYDGAKALMDKLSSVQVKEFKTVSGGRSTGDPCKGNSYHGFLGREKEVVTSITDWIKAH
jgi:dienelactone hydrolase